eukprot:3060687-Heterocapsa_arctica.AAC.1
MDTQLPTEREEVQTRKKRVMKSEKPLEGAQEKQDKPLEGDVGVGVGVGVGVWVLGVGET